MKYFILFIVVCTLFVGLFDLMVGHGIYEQVRSESFPHVTGIVTHSELVTHPGHWSGSGRHRTHTGPTYEVKVAYDYRIHGKSYHSDRYRFFSGSNGDRSGQQAIVASLPVGKQVDVFYDPANPSYAALQAGLRGGDLLILMFLLPFNMIMLGGWWRGVSFLRSRQHAATGGVRVEETIAGTQARFGRLGAVPTAIIALGLAGFIGIIAVCATVGTSPSMTLMVRVWCGLGILALVALIAKWMYNRASPRILTIDRTRGELTLPNAKRISIDHVTSMDVQTSASNKGNTKSMIYCYKPTIHYTDEMGVEHTACLPVRRNRPLAENFNAWLRENLGLARQSATPADA